MTAGPRSPDEQLIRRVALGERRAFEELYDSLAPMVLLRLRRRADGDVAAEVLQDTFVKVWRSAADFRGEGEVAAWVWSIASRCLIDRFRRETARPLPVPVGDLGEEGHLRGPEDAVLADLAMTTALAGLSPELRQVLQATVLDGLTMREAATLLGIPEGTVKTRARRARIHLREALA